MSTTTLAIGILALAAVAVIVFLTVSSNRRRKAIEDVPPGLRPAYSDEQLETTIFERYQAWGLVMTIFFALFFPIYYFAEPNRLNAETEEFFVESVVRGGEEYANLCANCHGPEGGGGFAPSPTGEGAWPAPNLRTIVARYSDNPNIKDIRDFVHATIDRGRPGTPMPTWGAGFGGSLNDQQLDDLVNWILANQEPAEAEPVAYESGAEIYLANCAKCHGENLEGIVGPSLAGIGQKHNSETLLAIIRNGIVVPTGAMMPPWQNGWMYENSRLDDEALRQLVEFLQAQTGEAADEADAQPEPQATQA